MNNSDVYVNYDETDHGVENAMKNGILCTAWHNIINETQWLDRLINHVYILRIVFIMD